MTNLISPASPQTSSVTDPDISWKKESNCAAAARYRERMKEEKKALLTQISLIDTACKNFSDFFSNRPLSTYFFQEEDLREKALEIDRLFSFFKTTGQILDSYRYCSKSALDNVANKIDKFHLAFVRNALSLYRSLPQKEEDARATLRQAHANLLSIKLLSLRSKESPIQQMPPSHSSAPRPLPTSRSVDLASRSHLPKNVSPSSKKRSLEKDLEPNSTSLALRARLSKDTDGKKPEDLQGASLKNAVPISQLVLQNGAINASTELLRTFLKLSSQNPPFLRSVAVSAEKIATPSVTTELPMREEATSAPSSMGSRYRHLSVVSNPFEQRASDRSDTILTPSISSVGKNDDFLVSSFPSSQSSPDTTRKLQSIETENNGDDQVAGKSVPFSSTLSTVQLATSTACSHDLSELHVKKTLDPLFPISYKEVEEELSILLGVPFSSPSV